MATNDEDLNVEWNHKDINEAILGVMEDVGYVKKRKGENLNYSFAGETDLIAALRPAMIDHGIHMHVHQIKSITRSTYTTKSGTTMLNTVTEGVVRFTHIGGTFQDCEATGEGSDSGDKSANKAMTGLFKYALRQTFCIETGDDPDKDHPEGPAGKKNVQQQGSSTKKTAAPQPTDMIDPLSTTSVKWASDQLARSVADTKTFLEGELSKGTIKNPMSKADFKTFVLGIPLSK